MRKPHYWKPAGPSSCPSELIIVDTETYYGENVRNGDTEYHTLRIGVALAYRYEKGRRTRCKQLVFTTANDFWVFVRSRLSRSRPVWIVGHNLPYDLGVLNGWKLLTSDEYHTEKRCISGTMFFVKGSIGGCGLNFLDTINYWHCSLSKIGKSVGLPKLTMPNPEDDDNAWGAYCANDVEVTARGVEAIIRFNREHCLGPFQPTIASAAFAGFRSAFMRNQILVHTRRDALRLEREAYYGGICETAYVGTVPRKPVYELDVCSMYPGVCRNDLPVKLIGYSNRCGKERIKKLAEKFLVFAEVEIVNTQHPYPVRGKKGTYYPVGRFTTSLAHPELMDALERGVVGYVHAVSWYTKAPIFKEYMEFFVSKKQAYSKEGNDAFSNVCKLYANSLYGKTGQVTPKWLKWGTEAIQILENAHGLPEGACSHWYDKPPDVYHFDPYIAIPPIPGFVECRTDYGELEIRVGEHESRDSCPAIAACVTSYARVLLRSYHAIAGKGEWFYSDTDSIWVSELGYKRLCDAGCVRPGELGYLDLKDVHRQLIVFGPKDYETNLTVKRKGVRVSATPTKDGGWEQLQFPGALEQIRSGLEGCVPVTHIVKHLHREISRCVVEPNGYTRPLVYPLENPERAKKVKRYERAK